MYLMPDYRVVSNLYVKTRICTYHESLMVKLSAGGMSNIINSSYSIMYRVRNYDNPNAFIFYSTKYTKKGGGH